MGRPNLFWKTVIAEWLCSNWHQHGAGPAKKEEDETQNVFKSASQWLQFRRNQDVSERRLEQGADRAVADNWDLSSVLVLLGDLRCVPSCPCGIGT